MLSNDLIKISENDNVKRAQLDSIRIQKLHSQSATCKIPYPAIAGSESMHQQEQKSNFQRLRPRLHKYGSLLGSDQKVIRISVDGA